MFDFNYLGDFDTDFLKQKNFNPFFDFLILLNSNHDPDLNFFSANLELLSICLYLLTFTEFNKMHPLAFDTFSSLHIKEGVITSAESISAITVEKISQSNKNERITKTNGRSMKYRNTDHGIISTFVKLSFLSMSVMRQI